MDDVQRLRQRRAVGEPRSRRRRVIIALFSATIASTFAGREQSRLQRRVAAHPAPRAASGCRGPVPGWPHRKARRENAIHQHQPAHAVDRMQLQAAPHAPAPPHQALRPAAAPRASARADRCISSPRSAGAAGQCASIGLERLPARSATLPAPGRRSPRGPKRLAQRASGFGFCQCNVHHQIRIIRQAASSNWA